MALTAAQRRRIPAKQFVYPRERKYPINTKKHAKSALSLAALHAAQMGGAKGKRLIDKVYGAVLKKYPELAESDSKTMRAFLRGKKRARSNPRMNKSQFDAMFREDIMPMLWQQEAEWQGGSWEHADGPYRRETYNNMLDSYVQERIVSSSAYDWHHPRWLETLRPPRDNPGHSSDTIRLEGRDGRYRLISAARIKRMSKKQLLEYLDFRGMIVSAHPRFGGFGLKKELQEDALDDFHMELRGRGKGRSARRNPPNNLFVTPESFEELQVYIDSTSAPAANMLIATAVMNYVAVETGNHKMVQPFFPTPQTEAELQAIFNAGVQGRSKKQIGEATTVANMAQNYAYSVLPRKNPRRARQLSAIGHKRHAERDDRRRKRERDAAHKEKKARRNPRRMTRKVSARSKQVKKAFALRKKLNSQMTPQTIMKDPAKAIRIFEKRLKR